MNILDRRAGWVVVQDSSGKMWVEEEEHFEGKLLPSERHLAAAKKVMKHHVHVLNKLADK